MAFFKADTRKLVCVQCKRCKCNVPAGVSEVPRRHIQVRCILCGEVRLYLPAEVQLDFPSHEVWRKGGGGVGRGFNRGAFARRVRG